MFQKQTKRKFGFSLIELMIVLVILGILAGFAIPAYMDYVVRTNVSTMISAAAGVQAAVAESRLQYGNFSQIIPGNEEDTFDNLGVQDPTLISEAISAVQFATEDEDHMAIVLCGSTAGEGADSEENTVDIYLTANVYLGGIKWGCMYEGENAAYVPGSCRTEYDPGVYGALASACPRVSPIPPD